MSGVRVASATHLEHHGRLCLILRSIPVDDGYCVGVHYFCAHRDVIAVLTETWRPSGTGAGIPRCEICQRIMAENCGVRFEGLFVHARCEEQTLAQRRSKRFAERWNAGESVEVLGEDFSIHPKRVSSYAATLRKHGYLLVQRVRGGGKRKMTAERKEAHDLTMAGTFRQSRYA